MNGTVVVGVEGTASSHDALVWAAQAAVARGAELHLVHAVGYPLSGYELAFDEALAQRGKQLLHDEGERAERAAPGVVVRLELDRDAVGPALTHRSREADLLVVGGHRLTTLERTFVGSRSYQVVAGAHCPVAVVPHLPAPDAARVVVGTDGSADGEAATALAAQEAERLGAELLVVHAFEEPALYTGLDYLSGSYVEQMSVAAEQVLAESVSGVVERHPGLRVTKRLVRGRPAAALLGAATDAALLVVGSRGRHGVARMLLGSVSHDVVLGAACPVLVARH